MDDEFDKIKTVQFEYSFPNLSVSKVQTTIRLKYR